MRVTAIEKIIEFRKYDGIHLESELNKLRLDYMRPELHLPGLHLTLTRINFNAIREFPAQNIQGR